MADNFLNVFPGIGDLDSRKTQRHGLKKCPVIIRFGLKTREITTHFLV